VNCITNAVDLDNELEKSKPDSAFLAKVIPRLRSSQMKESVSVYERVRSCGDLSSSISLHSDILHKFRGGLGYLAASTILGQ